MPGGGGRTGGSAVVEGLGVKLLLDSCVWGGALEALRLERHDVASVGAWPSDPGDEAILQVAFGAILTVTSDRVRIRAGRS